MTKEYYLGVDEYDGLDKGQVDADFRHATSSVPDTPCLVCGNTASMALVPKLPTTPPGGCVCDHCIRLLNTPQYTQLYTVKKLK